MRKIKIKISNYQKRTVIVTFYCNKWQIFKM
jgi:hypothetical protein